MKGQKKPSHRRIPEEGHEDPDYVQLRDLSGEVRPRTMGVLGTLAALGINTEALRRAGVMEQPIQKLLAKELSCSRYFRWAFFDNFIEKILQGLILNKQDISQEEANFCRSLIRQMPSGRSLLLHHACALRKVYAARGFVLTTEMVLNQAVKISIAAFLSYRLYERFTTGSSDFLEFTTIFNENSKKGVNSLVYLLAKKVEPELLYLLLASPAIIGVLKGLWDTQKSQRLTEHDITQLQEMVDHHTDTLIKRSYLLRDVLRQLIPMPGFSSVSDRVQKAEQQLRWDGRIKDTERDPLFLNIEKLALYGTGMSQINAMQSMAKIAHSCSIKDFHRLQDAGYSEETLMQILRIKTKVLCDLRILSNCAGVQPEAQQNSKVVLQRSLVSRVYATYLLWWLGMGTFKNSLLFWPFKFGKLALEALFLKTIIESILEVIRCPDKKYFSLGFGEYEVRANDLTSECFKEFVRQFRLLSEAEAFEPFLSQLNNFDFTEVDSIDLSDKDLTSDETIKILKVLKNKNAFIKQLNLGANKINNTLGLSFPNSLQSLNLGFNNIGAVGALKLPDNLQSLDLRANRIGTGGIKGLKLPDNLTSLDLSSNRIGAEGIKELKLPDNLTSLDLSDNGIGNNGTQRLKLPDNLKSLNLSSNDIGNDGAQRLKLPDNLKSLNLGYNKISPEGTQGLITDRLRSLDLSGNDIGNDGAQRLKLPENLELLSLSDNGISDAGAQGLKLPDNLYSLILSDNNIGAEGAQGLNLTDRLQFLNLDGNNISDVGAQGLKLPDNLHSLILSRNNIGSEGVQGLTLPDNLQFLDLRYNNIGAAGAQGLKLPDNLRSLYLGGNNISSQGAQGLKLPQHLQSLILWGNDIGAEGAQGLELPDTLQSLGLDDNNIGPDGGLLLKLPDNLELLSFGRNNIGPEGARRLKLPDNLQYLYLSGNDIGSEGAQGLKLPDNLQSLFLWNNNITDVGSQGLKLPDTLQFLDLSGNSIGDAGVNALLKKIPGTKLTRIDLAGNPYNFTSIDVNRILQQQVLLKNCQYQLCYADTSLSQNTYQTSSATRVQPSLFFSWLKKPFDKLAEYASGCMSETLGSLSARLERVLSQSPSYFPNIHSPEINDWQPSGSVMLHQFKAGRSNVLLLSAPQTAIQLSLRSIAR